MSMALEFLYINICSFSTIFIYVLVLVYDFLVTRTGKSKSNGKAKGF